MPLVLVVDDDASYADPLVRRLRLMGLDAAYTASGMAALEFCRSRPPDLILLDWILPGSLSGRATLAILRKSRQTREIPVIVISGQRLEPDDERVALACGARNFFSKIEIGEAPSSAASLERHVRALLPASAKRAPEAEPAVATLERPPSSSSPQEAPAKDGRSLSSPIAPTLLVIDDQAEMAELLGQLFKQDGYRVHWANNGKAGVSRAMTEYPDLIVLDLHMPETDGREICRAIREKNVASALYLPILILTGDARQSQHVQCLNIGADDFLVKPPPNEVLCARVNALLRRTRFLMDANDRLVVGRATLDCRAHRFHVGDDPGGIALTKTEAGILFLLMSARGRPLDRGLIHRKVSRSSTIPDPRSSTIKSHVSHMRAKLGSHGRLIVPVNGEAAYRFDAEACRS
ncbi:MAG: response regulator transcription factor [Elusimicrobia bacterium]|nr:response regulator transcription factor [Elusimicrobiota bacterium]